MRAKCQTFGHKMSYKSRLKIQLQPLKKFGLHCQKFEKIGCNFKS
jgi:hypothetical protein